MSKPAKTSDENTSTLESAQNFGDDAQMGTVAEADTSATDDAIAKTAEEHEDAPRTIPERGKSASAPGQQKQAQPK